MKIHVLGDAFCDVVVNGLSNIPSWGSGELSSSISHYSGGSALNTAIQIHSLLATTMEVKSNCSRNEIYEQVVMFTALGEDEQDIASQVIQKSVKLSQINLKATRIKNQPTGTCVVLSGLRDRAFLTCAGAIRYYSIEHLDFEELSSCDHLHLGGMFSLRSLTSHLHTKIIPTLLKKNPGLTISLDTNSDDSNGDWGASWLLPTLPLINVLKMNEYEAQACQAYLAKNESEQNIDVVTWFASQVREVAIITYGK